MLSSGPCVIFTTVPSCLWCQFLSSLIGNRPASKKHSLLPRLSSLSSLGDSAPGRRSPGHHRQPSDCTETTGLVQRCVIIQKDQHGFGFTVSGDRIVLVQSVRPGGAAMEAGVQEGDRIVKVNGTMVTNSSHLEVVKLIKSGAYVALTLLGPPPPSVGLSSPQHDVSVAGMPMCPPPPPPPPLPPPQRITDPKPLQDPEVQKHATQILRKMLQQEEAELQRLLEVYSRNPTTTREERMVGARRRVSQLQLKILQETGSSVDLGQPCCNSGSAGLRGTEGRLSLDSQDGDSGLDSGTERFPSLSEISLNRNSVLSDPGLDSPRTSPVITAKLFQHPHRRQGSDTPFLPSAEQGLDRTLRPLIIGPEEDCDPGYFNNECDTLFQDLGKLKSRPAHLGVFLRYIFSQADPSPLLFYLCAEVCQQMNAKDSRALGKEIWNIFLEKNAPLRIKLSEPLLAEIESRLRNGEDARSAFSEAQDAAMPEIQEQIQDYRTKRTMGLGSLYGENDLLDLDGDPQKERQVAEKQLAHLGDILSKYEEDRSSPMAFALSTYMSHTGIRMREARPTSTSEKSQAFPDKDKWLPFFPKAKKSSSAKKDKDAMEDKKRNPILKYIGKPKSSSQSTFHVPLSPVEVKPGNVRNIIQHFENNQHCESQEPGSQRLSTGSFPEELLDSDRLFQRQAEPGAAMQQGGRAKDPMAWGLSAVSDCLPRSLENPTPPYTPKMGRRSIESPNLGFSADSFLPHVLEDELGQLSDLELEPDAQNWQHTVGREVTAHLTQREIERQEVINELFATEASHLRILRVLDGLFYQRMKREGLLSREELGLLFPNLPDLIDIHNSLSESMKRLREEGPIIKEIGDLMLSRLSSGPFSFPAPAREEIQQVVADFCSYQSIALELIKTKQRKETRFQIFMQVPPAPLSLESPTGLFSPHPHRLGHQAAAPGLFPSPCLLHPQNLDLTSRRMIHEGALSWRISKEKTVGSLVLQDPDVSPILSHASSAGAEAEEVSSAKRCLCPNQSQPPASPLGRIPCQGPACSCSLPCLVENLRHLILHSLVPCRDPEDDLTPTPSVAGGVVQSWDSALPSQEQPMVRGEPIATRADLTGQTPSDGTEPEPAGRPSTGDAAETGWSSDGSQEGPQEAEQPLAAEGQGGYKVVRKAEVEGAKDATPLADSSQSETELHEGGGANVDGNYFYISMPASPAESSTEPPARALPASPTAHPHSPGPTGQPQGPPQPVLSSRQHGQGGLDGVPPPEPPAPSLAIQDVDMIFRTIEQLTLKLTRLKVGGEELSLGGC
nr:rho guanine nucleotide exchange factor 11 [Pelodiscus sinensis]|eukprot:XP_025035922.1 rho guanine nucleotide exchange factor 11 [Pelodiscus sinensis]